jgi:hypothetical protein
MRLRWFAALAASGAVAVLLAGCSLPEGVDGKIGDDWAAIGEPKIFTPSSEECHSSFNDVAYLAAYRPVDCIKAHQVETVHVGTFTGAAGNRKTPPPAGSPEARAAYAECAAKAAAYLGADLHTARLWLGAAMPSPAAWAGGARWFRCDLGEVDGLDDGDLVSHEGSLKGALKAASPLSLGCYNPKLANGDVQEMVPIDCAKAHHSEFVGTYLAPNVTWDAFQKDTKAGAKCYDLVAKYVGVSRSTVKYRSGWIAYYPSEQDWSAGDRAVRCFLWRSDKTFKRSLKGAGSKGLPIG